jgi:hypothetical protein
MKIYLVNFFKNLTRYQVLSWGCVIKRNLILLSYLHEKVTSFIFEKAFLGVGTGEVEGRGEGGGIFG